MVSLRTQHKLNGIAVAVGSPVQGPPLVGNLDVGSAHPSELVPTDCYRRRSTAANTGMTSSDHRGTSVYQRRHDAIATFTRCASGEAVKPKTSAFKSAFFLHIVCPLDHRLHPVVSLTSDYLRRPYCDKTIEVVVARPIHAIGRTPPDYAAVADTLLSKISALNKPK